MPHSVASDLGLHCLLSHDCPETSDKYATLSTITSLETHLIYRAVLTELYVYLKHDTNHKITSHHEKKAPQGKASRVVGTH